MYIVCVNDLNRKSKALETSALLLWMAQVIYVLQASRIMPKVTCTREPWPIASDFYRMDQTVEKQIKRKFDDVAYLMAKESIAFNKMKSVCQPATRTP